MTNFLKRAINVGGRWLFSMNGTEYFTSSYLKSESLWKHFLLCCSRRISIETPGQPPPPTHTHSLVFLSVGNWRVTMYIPAGFSPSDTQGHNQFLFSWNVQIIRNSDYSAGRQQTAWWKDVPTENNSDHIFVRRMRCLQLSVTNHIRGGKQECFGLQKITLITCRNTTFTGRLSQNSVTLDVCSVTHLASW